MNSGFSKKNEHSPLLKTITQLIGVNGASYFLLLLISIVIFRTVDKSSYGLYVIMLSLFAVVELLMAGFNDSIVRFLKDKISLVDKQNIVLFVFFYKYFLIFLFIFVIYGAKKYGLFEFLVGNYNEVANVVDSFLLVAILNGVFSIFIGINNCILNAHYQYKLTANIGFLRNLAYLLTVIILSFFSKNYLDYLYSSVALSVFILIYLSIKINKEYSEFSILNLISVRFDMSIGKKYILPYAIPLTGSSSLTYVKNHLPILILGKEFTLEDVAVFSILKTFFKALHSVSGSFFDPMTSKFLELKSNIQDFSKKMNIVFYFTLFLRLSSFAILSFLIQYFFSIYKIENSEVNQFLFYVLGFEYVVAGMILNYGMILKLDKDTNKILFASIARFFVELLLIYFILLDYGVMAAALILLTARYVETVITYLFVSQQRVFNQSGLVLVAFIPVNVYYIFNLTTV